MKRQFRTEYEFKHPFRWIVLLAVLTLLFGCSGDSSTGPKESDLKFDNCNAVFIEDCNTLSLTRSDFNLLGWPRVLEYSGCGKSGKVRVTYSSNGCITNLEEI